MHELKLSELDVKMRFLVKEVEKENNAGLDEKNCKINEMLDMHWRLKSKVINREFE